MRETALRSKAESPSQATTAELLHLTGRNQEARLACDSVVTSARSTPDDVARCLEILGAIAVDAGDNRQAVEFLAKERREGSRDRELGSTRPDQIKLIPPLSDLPDPSRLAAVTSEAAARSCESATRTSWRSCTCDSGNWRRRRDPWTGLSATSSVLALLGARAQLLGRRPCFARCIRVWSYLVIRPREPPSQTALWNAQDSLGTNELGSERSRTCAYLGCNKMSLARPRSSWPKPFPVRPVPEDSTRLT